MAPLAQRILAEHGRIATPLAGDKPASKQALITLLANIAYYGYGLSEPAYAEVARASDEELAAWWKSLDTALATISGDDKNMDRFVVYKNFPAEVIAMDELGYWTRQILMYWGFPNSYFTEEEDEREAAGEKLPVKILHPAGDTSLTEIRDSILHLPARWTSRQFESICELATLVNSPVPVAEAPFKENMVLLSIFLMEEGHPVGVSTATDVLRLAVGLSDGDISLREASKLRRFTRPERRFLLGLLEQSGNLNEDIGRRRGKFKRLLFALHPGDYKARFPKVVAAYDLAYRDVPVASHNREVEKLLVARDKKALTLLKARPGDFVRRLRVATRIFGRDAADAFVTTLPKLSTSQLLKIECYLRSVNHREQRTFPPKGNWSMLQIRKMESAHRFDKKLARALADTVAAEVGTRVSKVVPRIQLAANVARVKLQGNESDLSPYGRGTVFPIPKNITFLRSASYWQSGATNGNLWYDNGWNFFDQDWQTLGCCCWNANKFGADASVFSGDPTNSKELEGRACQMIDLYLEKLKAEGVRYAVWNILCYSRKSFDDAVLVHAALQWGEEPQKGNLFDPARSVFSFPVRGKNMTKYIAYIDIEKRELVYLDANLYGRVQSAASNGKILAKTMPAFIEYLGAQPSVHDLFKGVAHADDGMPVLYEDSERLITGGKAYVFQTRNRHNQFDAFSLDSIL